MKPARALELAISFLDSFKEAGNIYDDYVAHERITDGDYDEMMAALRRMADLHKE